MAAARTTLPHALGLAEQIAAAALLAVRAGREVPTVDTLVYAHDQSPELLRSHERYEGLAAWSERRLARLPGASGAAPS
jgi:hypothetical protein